MSSRIRPFVGAAIVGLLMLTASTAHAQEASDSLATATPIAAIPFAAATPTIGATTAADEPRPGCTFGTDPATGSNSVWYRYTATADGSLIADTLGSTYDTVLAVWDGAPDAGGIAIGCADDDFESSGTLQSVVPFNAVSGHTYYFQAAFYSYPGFGPEPTLVFHLAPPLPPLEASITMDSIGRAAGATGVVEVSGVVTCSRPAFVNAIVHVQQQNGRIAAAALFLQGPCGPQPQRATGRFVGQNARFTPGQSVVTVLGSAQERFPGPTTTIYTQASVRLQGASPKTLYLDPPPQP